MAQSSLDTVWTHRMTLPAGYDRQQFTEKIAESLAKRDPNAALDWASALPDPEERTKALAAIAGPLGEQSPEAGMKLAMSLSEGPDRNAIQQILRRYMPTRFRMPSAKQRRLLQGNFRRGAQVSVRGLRVTKLIS